MKLFFKKTAKDKERELLRKYFIRMIKHSPENQCYFDKTMDELVYEYYEANIRSENKIPIPRNFLEDKDLEYYSESIFKLVGNLPTLSLALILFSSLHKVGIDIKKINLCKKL
jgi:hypothetical protein